MQQLYRKAVDPEVLGGVGWNKGCGASGKKDNVSTQFQHAIESLPNKMIPKQSGNIYVKTMISSGVKGEIEEVTANR